MDFACDAGDLGLEFYFCVGSWILNLWFCVGSCRILDPTILIWRGILADLRSWNFVSEWDLEGSQLQGLGIVWDFSGSCILIFGRGTTPNL